MAAVVLLVAFGIGTLFHSAENVASGFSFVPVVDVSTHTFGANVALRPDQIDLAKVGRLMNRMRLK
jgi:hypothetical protein